MTNLSTNILLGYTKNKELIFGNIKVKERNGKKEFTASFDTVAPKVKTDDLVKDAIESYIENIDDSHHLSLLKDHDCAPSELAEMLENDSYDVLYDFFDNSLYPEIYTINDEEVFFESVGCGQNDTRNEIEGYFVSKELYDFIHELWDKFHLKEIGDHEVQKLSNMLKEYDNVDEEEVIEKWLNDIYETYLSIW